MVSEIVQLPVACAWGNMNTIDSLAFMFSLQIGRQCTSPPPPHRNGKVVISGQCDILVQADVPHPPEIEIVLNMNAIEQREVIKYILQSTPPPSRTLCDSIPEQETGEFQFEMDMDIWTRTLSATPLQPKK